VSASNNLGTSEYSVTSSFITGSQIVSVKELEERTKEFNLIQNYPNPFNPSTTILYDISKTAYVNLVIYDVLGRVVANLVDGVQSAKRYSVEWNPSRLSSGVYFYRIQARSQDGSVNVSFVKKLLYMK
jgi:hypothetical protein